ISTPILAIRRSRTAPPTCTTKPISARSTPGSRTTGSASTRGRSSAATSASRISPSSERAEALGSAAFLSLCPRRALWFDLWLTKGRDSARHSGVNELGIFGNTSMLGSNLPVAAGLAYTFKMERADHVVVAYFGEGASNTGDFHEALNFAGVQRLPILFVCENNLYAYSVPVEKSMAIDDVADRAASYGFDGVSINGNDVLAVYQSTQGALARARN